MEQSAICSSKVCNLVFSYTKLLFADHLFTISYQDLVQNKSFLSTSCVNSINKNRIKIALYQKKNSAMIIY